MVKTLIIILEELEKLSVINGDVERIINNVKEQTISTENTGCYHIYRFNSRGNQSS